MFVALFLLDRERFPVPLFGRLKVPLFLGDPAQLVIAVRSVVLVTLFLLDRERFPILLLGLLQVTQFMRDYSQLVVCGRQTAFLLQVFED